MRYVLFVYIVRIVRQLVESLIREVSVHCLIMLDLVMQNVLLYKIDGFVRGDVK